MPLSPLRAALSPSRRAAPSVHGGVNVAAGLHPSMAAAHLPTLRPAASISRTSEAAATAEAMRWEKAVAPVEDHAGARSRQPQLALPPNPALLLLLLPNPVLGPPIDRTRGGEEGEHERAEAKKAARAGRPRRLAGDTADLLLFCKVVAINQLNRDGNQGSKEFLVEVLMLSLLHHQNFVQYEYMPLGSLEDHLHDEVKRKQLLRNWALNWHDFTWQPIEEVYSYFGTKVLLQSIRCRV